MFESHKDHSMSREDLAIFGLETMAYVRPVTINGRKVHVVHAADGTLLTIVMDRDTAFVTLRQYEMDPQSVH
ncbi:MAG: DUF1150 family protein [Alphaproteobacteria bacterium]|nr:DUF1150 family protein [Alphaproteobacteria bacterium]